MICSDSTCVVVYEGSVTWCVWRRTCRASLMFELHELCTDGLTEVLLGST